MMPEPADEGQQIDADRAEFLARLLYLRNSGYFFSLSEFAH